MDACTYHHLQEPSSTTRISWTRRNIPLAPTKMACPPPTCAISCYVTLDEGSSLCTHRPVLYSPTDVSSATCKTGKYPLEIECDTALILQGWTHVVGACGSSSLVPAHCVLPANPPFPNMAPAGLERLIAHAPLVVQSWLFTFSTSSLSKRPVVTPWSACLSSLG